MSKKINNWKDLHKECDMITVRDTGFWNQVMKKTTAYQVYEPMHITSKSVTILKI